LGYALIWTSETIICVRNLNLIPPNLMNEPKQHFRVRANGLSILPNGNLMIAAHTNVKIWHLDGRGHLTHALEFFQLGESGALVSPFPFPFPSASRLAIPNTNTSTRMFICSHLKRLDLWRDGADSTETCIRKVKKQVWDLCVLTRSLIATASENCVQLWDIEKKKLKHTFYGHQMKINCISAIGENFLISGDEKGEIKIWNINQKRDKFWHRLRKKPSSACLQTLHSGTYITVLCHFSIMILKRKKLEMKEMKGWDVCSPLRMAVGG